MLDKIIIDGLSFALPLFIMAIGGIYSERSGITNLALEGLQGAGAFVGALVATFLMLVVPSDSQIPYYAAMLFAMIGGMLYAMLHAVLCVNFKANQVISGVVINILAMALTVFLTKVVNRIAFGAASDKFLLNVYAFCVYDNGVIKPVLTANSELNVEPPGTEVAAWLSLKRMSRIVSPIPIILRIIFDFIEIKATLYQFGKHYISDGSTTSCSISPKQAPS